MLIAKLNEVESRQKTFLGDPLNFSSIGSALLIYIIHILILYFKLGFVKTNLVIHYNVVYGPDFIGRGWYIYFLPAAALVILLGNTFFARFLYRKEKLAAYFLNFANLAVQVIFLIASIAVVMING